MLKLDVAFLYDLLGASQEHKIKPKKFAQTDIDEVIIGHTNEAEYKKLLNNEFMEALRDRTVNSPSLHPDPEGGRSTDNTTTPPSSGDTSPPTRSRPRRCGGVTPPRCPKKPPVTLCRDEAYDSRPSGFTRQHHELARSHRRV